MVWTASDAEEEFLNRAVFDGLNRRLTGLIDVDRLVTASVLKLLKGVAQVRRFRAF